MRIKALILAFLLPAVVCAQAKPAAKPAAKPSPMTHDMSTMGEMMQGGMKSGWGELDAFHSLLMATWHPAEKDSLAMARSLAATLAAAADAWAKSKGPAGCDNAALRQELPGIVANTKAFAGVATNPAKDADVKAALKKVHDGFEKAAEPCMQAKDSVKKPMG